MVRFSEIHSFGVSRYVAVTLQRHNTENPKQILPERNCGATVPISTFLWLWANYIFPRSVCLFTCRKKCGTILGIYKSLRDTWRWKLGLRPHNALSGNTEMGFSLQCSSLVCQCIERGVWQKCLQQTVVVHLRSSWRCWCTGSVNNRCWAVGIFAFLPYLWTLSFFFYAKWDWVRLFSLVWLMAGLNQWPYMT